tara:strand:+ start:5745 stop:8672 length:2928 start_codon:yes stop_codon:yes gene_type:complete
MANQKVWNSEFVNALDELEEISKNKGDIFRARAYKSASDVILTKEEDIYSVDQLKNTSKIGKTILDKLNSLVETGKIEAIEKEKSNPLHQFSKIYGVGPKKAVMLTEKVKSIDELRANQDLLNNKQKIGLKYFEDIQKRIPRKEIDEYNKVIQNIVKDLLVDGGDARAEIVGSYRRGALSSGDIDIIFTSNDIKYFYKFLENIFDANMILEYLAKGEKKALIVGTLGKEDSIPRRIDFLYSPPKEYAFALLYFTGSKAFNIVMRKEALKMGYSLNEHGFTPDVSINFEQEKDIFDFLELEYKTPIQRKSGNDVLQKNDSNLKLDGKSTIRAKVSDKSRPQKKMKYTGNQFEQNYKNMDLGDIVKLIRRASDAYYNSTPIMTDTEFDILRDYVEEIAPDHPVLKEIGAPVKSRKKVSLPVFMPSMDKVKPESLDKWLLKYNGPYVVSAKLDGVSALLVKSKKEQKLYTRGNGSVGQDISHLIPHISTIPIMAIDGAVEYVVRGELIIKDYDFENRFSSEKANARNMVSGLVTRKTIQKEELKYTRFVVYEVISPVLSPSDQMEFALKNGFEVVHNEKQKTMSVEKASNTLKEWRKEDDYSIDGIIISQDGIFERQNSNPKHSVAFKMVLSDQTKESIVTGVTWTTSKHGLKKPVVQIEPIKIGGVTVSNISGQNGRFIESNMIGKGAIVEVVRRGDVIPYIERVIKPAKTAAMPEGKYEWTATKVDIVVPKDDESREKLALAFFSGIGVDGLGSGNLKKFSNAGYKTIPDIFSMNIENIRNIEGFKEKSSAKIFNGIQDIKKDNYAKVPIEKIMGLSGTFGRGLGEKKIREVFKKYPDILNKDYNESELIESVKSVQGFSTKTATQFVESLERFKQFANNIGLKYENRGRDSWAVNDPVHKKDGKLYGKSLVFTGGKDEELMKLILENGGEVSNSVTSKTFAVISKDPTILSGKSKKAVDLGIPVYSVEVFKNMYI